MAYRFTNTEKWNDHWFSQLRQIEMLLFMYLCDNCDIAGFVEINIKLWSVVLNSSIETIEGALKGLQRGLIFSKNTDCIYIKNFLKHQKNIPLNEKNKAHIGIIRRFELYSYKFDIQDINEFIKGASKGLDSPSGNGNGIGIGNGIGKPLKKKFIEPKLNEVLEYCKERNNDVDANKFINFYESKGWLVGKTKMVDWKAAVRNWETKSVDRQPQEVKQVYPRTIKV
jgi:hypothetical protein